MCMLVLSHTTASELGSWSPPAGIVPPSLSMQFDTAVEQGSSEATLQKSSSYGSSIPSAQHKEAEEPKHIKRQRLPVPEGQKDEKYWEFRRKNNISAKHSRESRRLKKKLEDDKKEQAIKENISLRAEMNVMRSEISSLRRLLKDANTTLSLWIKARQATESAQLPPSLRDYVYPMGR